MGQEFPSNGQKNFNVLLGGVSLPYVLQAVGSVAMTHEYVFNGVGADGLEVIANRGRFVGQVLERAGMIQTTQTALSGYATGSIGRMEAREGLFTDQSWDIRRDYSDFDEMISQLIQAGHSSFNKGNEPLPKKVWQRLPSIARRWFFPPWDESLDRLKAMRPLLERDLSVVVYGEPGYGEDYSGYASFAECSVQPKADVWKVWGLTEDSPTEDIKAAMDQRGIDTLTWDTIHGQDFDDPAGLLKRLLDAGLVQRLHLSIGRADQKKRLKDLGKEQVGSQTIGSRRAFIESPAAALETPEGQQLKMYIESMEEQGRPGVVVLEEMPQMSVAKAAKEQKSIIANIRLVRDMVVNK